MRPDPPARDPRFQVGLLLLMGVLAVALDGLPALAALAAAGLAWALATRPSPQRLLLLLGAIALATWGLMFSQGLFYQAAPRTVLLVLVPPDAPLVGPLTGGVRVYAEGIVHGAVQSLRLVATLSAGLAVAWTLDPHALLASFAALRLPHALAFCTTAAVRFLPVTVEEARIALRAQRMRGLRLSGAGGLNALRAVLSIARPTLAAAVRRAETVALASASRAYDPDRRRTSLRPLRMRPAERILLAAAALLTLAVVAAKTAYLLYAAGFYHSAALDPLYAFVREVL